MEGPAEPPTPDLRDVEGKVGRKTPEGLLRGLRGDWELGTSGALLLPGVHGPGLGDKIVALRLELVSKGCMLEAGPGVRLERKELKTLRLIRGILMSPQGPAIGGTGFGFFFF